MRLLKFLGYLSVLIVAAFLVIIFLGSRLPAEHTASASAVIPASQSRTWDLITDVAAQPRWRTGLKAVTLLAPENGAPCWLEAQTGMSMPLCADISETPAHRVVRIADPKLPFGGTWDYQLTPITPDSTNVTITENGTTGPAIWRFMGHYVIGEDKQIHQYLSDLQKQAAKTP